MEEERKYCVYCHTNKVNGKKYIGITCQEVNKRWQRGCTYKECPCFYNAIKKYGWDEFTHEVLIEGLTREEAESGEVRLISELNTRRPNGYNLDSGGNANKSWSEYSKAKRSANITGEKNPFYGHHHSEETKEKIRKCRIGVSNSKHTQEFKDKLRERRSIPVVCVETGEWFPSAVAAGKHYGGGRSTITGCVRNGKTFRGYHWRYADRKEVV